MNFEFQAKPTILIIDDSEQSREILRAYLEKEKYKIAFATNGIDGLNQVRKNPPDLVLLDILMPGMDGFKVCSAIKEDPKTRLIPIIMVTALNEKKDRIRGIEVGSDDFISVPFDKEELLARVKSLLRMKHYSDQLDNAEKVIIALAKAVEAKDAYTKGHVDRVATLASNLAKESGLSNDEQQTLYMGGLLHDIGKIGISDSILNKPGKLTDEEFIKIKEHPSTGEDICKPLNSIRSLLPVIKHHHEKMDGSGYPSGLKGDEIPISARIMAVVDVYDALTSDRPYRKGMDKEKALNILQEEVNKGWWDPVLFKKFKSLLLQ